MEIINLGKDNSIFNQFISEIRNVDVQNDRMRFRRNCERMGEIMAYEISKTFKYETKNITTPLGTAKINLMKQFRLSERQTIAILEMKLQQLANLEQLKIEQELKEKLAIIKNLESILKSPKKIKSIIKKELAEIREKYGDERRTKIIAHGVKNFSTEDLIPNEDTIITITKNGYIKRLPPETFKTQSRGGKGVIGLTTKESDVVEHFFTTTTHSDILFFTTQGYTERQGKCFLKSII